MGKAQMVSREGFDFVKFHATHPSTTCQTIRTNVVCYIMVGDGNMMDDHTKLFPCMLRHGRADALDTQYGVPFQQRLAVVLKLKMFVFGHAQCVHMSFQLVALDMGTAKELRIGKEL
eukprot:3026556-Pyramimonas_sp.AAC.1